MVNNMKTTAELKAHYRDVIIPMVAQYNFDHGTDVKTWECVRVKGNNEVFLNHPTFTLPPKDYTFALTILEARPVFVGDVLYHKGNMEGNFTVTPDGIAVGYCNYDMDCFEYLTWTPPEKKRTFMLNGVELPCPTKEGDFFLTIYGMGRYRFCFESAQDMRIVGDCLEDLLTEARDKE